MGDNTYLSTDADKSKKVSGVGAPPAHLSPAPPQQRQLSPMIPA